MPKPDYQIYRKSLKSGEILFRRISGGKEAGLIVRQSMYEFPFSVGAEQFINRKDAEEIIKSLKEYFGI